MSYPKAQLRGLPVGSVLPCGDTNPSEKRSRSRKKNLCMCVGVSKDVSFNIQSQEKYELGRKETKKI